MRLSQGAGSRVSWSQYTFIKKKPMRKPIFLIHLLAFVMLGLLILDVPLVAQTDWAAAIEEHKREVRKKPLQQLRHDPG
jgi:hypothetical protein